MLVRMERMGRLFKGRELEGRYQEVPTLFVEGNESYDKIVDTAKEHNLGHVYFGANKTEVDWINMLPIIIDVSETYLVTVETTDPKTVPQEVKGCVHIIWRIENQDMELLKDEDTIKIETKEYVRCIPKFQMYKNDFTRYKDDEDISD